MACCDKLAFTRQLDAFVKRREPDESKLVAEARIVGGAKLVDFLADGTPCVTY